MYICIHRHTEIEIEREIERKSDFNVIVNIKAHLQLNKTGSPNPFPTIPITGNQALKYARD